MMTSFRIKEMWRRRFFPVLVIVALLAAGCSGHEGRVKVAAVPEIKPGVPAGYLSSDALPSSISLAPPPLGAGSAALSLDEDISRRSLALRGTARWQLAVSDADLSFPHAAGTFSCVLNAPITQKSTPHLYMLLRRAMIDLVRSTSAAKSRYQRPRPFVWNQEPICTPDEQDALAHNGSYPSGHTAIGWGWALILTEISPDRTDAILARGRAFGESRNVCNVHWHSDVVEGRLIASGTVARLHADPAFRADLEVAVAELAAVRQKGLKPTRDCDAEAAALAAQPSLAQ